MKTKKKKLQTMLVNTVLVGLSVGHLLSILFSWLLNCYLISYPDLDIAIPEDQTYNLVFICNIQTSLVAINLLESCGFVNPSTSTIMICYIFSYGVCFVHLVLALVALTWFFDP